MDVLAAIQGLLAVVTVETISHGSILEKQNSITQVGNLRGKSHTEKTGIKPNPNRNLISFAGNTQLLCVMDDKQGNNTTHGNKWCKNKSGDDKVK